MYRLAVMAAAEWRLQQRKKLAECTYGWLQAEAFALACG
jgi:hypothetical protein